MAPFKKSFCFTPEELLLFLHEIEAQNGRERVVHWGERTLDLDILFYEDCVMATKELTIPHKSYQILHRGLI